MSDEDSDDAPPRVLKNAYDLQRMKLEKLMKNPVRQFLQLKYCCYSFIH